MPKLLIDILMYGFEALLLYYYADSLFFDEKKRIIKIGAVVCVNTLLCIIYQLGVGWLNALLVFILYAFSFVFIFGISYKAAVFHSLIFVIVMSATEILVMGISALLFDNFNAMQSNFNAYIFVVVASKLAYSSIIVAIKKFFANRRTRKTQDGLFWILFVFPLSNFLMIILIRYMTFDVDILNVSIFAAIAAVFVLFANIIVFIIYERAQKNLDELYDLKAITFQQELDKKYFEVIEQTNDEIRHFSHDVKNHLLQIRYIDDIEETHKYLDRLISDVENISYVGISDNKMLNLIVSKYISICDKKGIKFTPSVKLANLSYINDVDLSALLNNLLDNSVDAAEKSENSEIELYVFSKNSRYDGVIIRNTCITTPETIGNKLITSKADKVYHGLGLNIVKKIIKKYDALYDWKYNGESKIFETDIAIPKQHRKGKNNNGIQT